MAFTTGPRQINRYLSKGDDAQWDYVVYEGQILNVSTAAAAGATTIRVDPLDATLASGTVIDWFIGDHKHRTELTAQETAGAESAQAYKELSLQTVGETTLVRPIPKGTQGYIASDISARDFIAVFRDKTADVGTDILTLAKEDIIVDDSTAAERGKIQVNIPKANSAGLTADVDPGNQLLDVWIDKALPKISENTTTHPHRIEIDEVVSSTRYQVSRGVVAIGPGGN